MIDERLIGERFRALAPELNERARRFWAASEARVLGRGGVAAVATASGISENTIRKGIREIDSGERLEDGRVRRRGGGRKPIAENDPGLVVALERLVAEDCRGDPVRVLLWTSKSVRMLAAELRGQGHEVHFTTVAALLRSLGYSLQSNRKTLEGAQHPDRDLQFRLINERVGAAIAAGEPAISIDTKKKELVGEFKNAGREWRPGGDPIKVSTHDFPSQAIGKAIPYGVYDIASNEGFVNVGITAETAQLAVASIRAWWQDLGRERYPTAHALQITADCGGGNGNRIRLWKTGSLGIDVVRFSAFWPWDRVTWEARWRLATLEATRPGRGWRSRDRAALHRELSDAISLVAGCSEPSRTPLRGSRRSALRAVLDCPAQLRWLAMNVAPEGDLRVKTSTSAARSTRARLAKPVPGTKILLRTTIKLSP